MMRIYVIKDELNDYGLPFFQRNDLMARRVFGYMASDPQSLISVSPGDYHLCCIGEFDERTAVIHPTEPVFICRATDLLSKEVQKE